MVGLTPGDVLDRYRVERVLASGGFGTVVRARHVHLGSGHALKLLHVYGGAERERLLREGRIQASLRHPGIVGVTDVVPLDVGVAVVMELVDGPDLFTWCARYRPTPEEIDTIAEQLFAAIAYAHGENVVHRDLKPDNVLVERRGDELTFRVTDFGLAVRDTEAKGRFTRTGQAMGTPGYMAPEQFVDARSVDARADIYALGAIFYELLAGRPAYTAASLVEAYAAAQAGEHPPLATVAPDAPGRMCEAIEAALRPDPAQRPESVAAMREIWRGVVPARAARWTEAALTAADPRPEADSGGLQAPTLAPTAGTPAPAPPAQMEVSVFASRVEPAHARWLGLALGVGVLGIGSGLVVGVMLIWGWNHREEPVAPAASAPVVAAPAEPGAGDVAAPTEDLAAPSGTAAAPPDVAPVDKPKAASAPSSEPASASAPAPAPASAQARVRVSGAANARLVSPSGRSWPASGAVPPGSYTLEVAFGSAEPTRVLTLDLAAGDTRSIRCTASLRVCE